jgi:hypothetical protein
MCLRTQESSYEWEKVLFQFELLFGRTKLHKDAHRSVLLVRGLLLSLYSLIYKTSTLQILGAFV